jgi:arginase
MRHGPRFQNFTPQCNEGLYCASRRVRYAPAFDRRGFFWGSHVQSALMSADKISRHSAQTADSEDRLQEPASSSMSLAFPEEQLQILALIGAASRLGMPDSACDQAPAFLRRHLATLPHLRGRYAWHALLRASTTLPASGAFPPPGLGPFSRRLAKAVDECVAAMRRFMVFGGDHACAIGTWTGAARGLRPRGDMGLIWIDAHMDAHTLSTSPSGRAHGMPVATLLGHGDPTLEFFGGAAPPAVLPRNLCLIGVRSFESGEAALLQRLGVRIVMMDEVRRRGLAAVLREALDQVSAHTAGFGVSLDLDAIDPRDAPGVTTAVGRGIAADDLLPPLRDACADRRCIGMEVVEFNPPADRNGRTAQLVEQIVLTNARR